MDRLLPEAMGLVSQGAKELTLIGQDTIAYGKDLSADRSTNPRTLLEKLNEVRGLDWIRVLYTYPTRLADEIEWAYRNLEKLVPYLDLPLQHLSDPVLERMRRGTPYEDVRRHVFRLKETVPGLIVRSTCIVAFPGETEEDFDLLRDRFEELEVDHLGVFRYSDEEGTSAADLGGKIPEEEAERRYAEMTEWAANYCQSRAQARPGTEVQVLVDGQCPAPVEVFPEVDPKGQWRQGRWYGQAPEIDGAVFFRSDAAGPGMFVPVRLEAVMYPDYLGECLG